MLDGISSRIEQSYLLPKEPIVVMYCDNCGDEIFEGSETYEVDGDTICQSCAESYTLKEYFADSKKIAERKDMYGI